VNLYLYDSNLDYKSCCKC